MISNSLLSLNNSHEYSEEQYDGDLYQSELDSQISLPHQYNNNNNNFQSDSSYLQDQSEIQEEAEYLDQTRIYNIAEVKSFVEELSCSICCHIIINPKTCQKCEAIFCTRCIQEWFDKKRKQVCPCCRSTKQMDPIFHYSFYNNHGEIHGEIMSAKVPKLLKILLGKLLLVCKNQNSGCEEVITYDFRQKHEEEYCEYSVVECENEGCEQKMFRRLLQDHKSDCPYELLDCRYCQESYTRNNIAIHINECPYRLIMCKWCRDKYSFIELAKHEHECIFRVILCQYCNREFFQSDMKTHTPFNCIMQQNEQMKKKLDKTVSENSQLRQDYKKMELEKNKYYALYNKLKHEQEQEQEQEYHEQFEQSNKQAQEQQQGSELNQSTNSCEYQEDFEAFEDVDNLEQQIIEEDIHIEEDEDDEIINEQNEIIPETQELIEIQNEDNQLQNQEKINNQIKYEECQEYNQQKKLDQQDQQKQLLEQDKLEQFEQQEKYDKQQQQENLDLKDIQEQYKEQQLKQDYCTNQEQQQYQNEQDQQDQYNQQDSKDLHYQDEHFSYNELIKTNYFDDSDQYIDQLEKHFQFSPQYKLAQQLYSQNTGEDSQLEFTENEHTICDY